MAPSIVRWSFLLEAFMKNNIVRTIAEVGIFAAIGFVLDEIQGVLAFSFVNGGSIGIAMIAVLIIAYRRGILPAVATGLIMGALDISTKAYIIHPAQLLLDYLLPYALVGVAGLFKYFFDRNDNKKTKCLWLVVGAVVGGLLKLLSHYLAGVIFWNNPSDFCWGLNEMRPELFSFVYNFAFIGPSIILCSILLVVLFLRAPKVLMTQGEVVTYVETKEHKNKVIQYSLVSALIAAGLFLLIFYLIKYINSLENYSSETEIYYVFSRNCMVFSIVGFVTFLLALNELFRIIKNKFHYHLMGLNYGIFLFALSIVGLARIIEMYTDKKVQINNLYWLWFTLAFVIGGVLITLFIISRKKESKK